MKGFSATQQQTKRKQRTNRMYSHAFVYQSSSTLNGTTIQKEPVTKERR
jgi:hypothetical protein